MNRDPQAYVDSAVVRMRERANRRRHHGLWLPLVVIGMGVIFLLDQMHVYPADRAFDFFWPAILIVAGIEWTLNCRSGRLPWLGLGLLTVGGLLLLQTLGYIHFQVERLWPLILIAVGLNMLVRRRGRVLYTQWVTPSAPGEASSGPASGSAAGLGSVCDGDDSSLDCNAFLGGIKRRVTTQDFKGGHLAALFGGFEVDLTRANIAGPQAVIEANALFGGGEIRVPDHWIVDVQGQAILGGYSDETHQIPQNAASAKRLIIRGTATFGGVVIKN